MKQLQNLHQVNDIINTAQAVLIYFEASTCSVCKVLKPKLETELSRNFPKIQLCEISVDTNKEIASYFTVFSAPTILVFFDKKEFKRYGKNISVTHFLQELERPYKLLCE